MNKLSFCYLIFFLFLISCTNDKVTPPKEKVEQAITESKKQNKPIKNHPDYTDSSVFPAFLDLDYVMGRFDPTRRVDFQKIDIAYADQEGRYMHKGAYESFKVMHAAAKKDEINLTIKSAARNFAYQKGIWERKWTGATLLEGKENAAKLYENHTERAIAILKYSSMPGSSRHHWGTDIDINSFNNSYFESGQGKKEFDWLTANARKFGFCRPYTKLGTDRSSGYQEEKWHWSYTPVANYCTEYARQHLENIMFVGFEGSDVAKQINIKDNYILGISSSCKN